MIRTTAITVHKRRKKKRKKLRRSGHCHCSTDRSIQNEYAVVKRGPLTEWWTLLLSRASDKRLVRNLDYTCVHHCRTASTMAVSHRGTSSSSSRGSSSSKERTGASMPAWSASVQRGPRPFLCDTVARNTFIASTGRPWSAWSRPPSWLWTYKSTM